MGEFLDDVPKMLLLLRVVGPDPPRARGAARVPKNLLLTQLFSLLTLPQLEWRASPAPPSSQLSRQGTLFR